MYHITGIKDAGLRHSSFRISHILFIEEALPGTSSELPNQIISSGSLQSTTWREGQEDDLFQPGILPIYDHDVPSFKL